MLWANMACCVKLSVEDLSCFSYLNKIELVDLRQNVHIITVLLRKWCHNNKHFLEFAPHHGRKMVGNGYGMKKWRHVPPYYVYSCTVLSAESASGRVCPLEGRYDAVSPSGGATRCHSYLNVGCDVSSVIEVIDTCSGKPGAILLTILSCHPISWPAFFDVTKFCTWVHGRKAQGEGTSTPEIRVGDANANCPLIFKKNRSEFTKTRHFKRKIHF